MNYINKYNSPLGIITIASNGESLIGLWFDNQKYFVSTLKEPVKKDSPVFAETKK